MDQNYIQRKWNNMRLKKEDKHIKIKLNKMDIKLYIIAILLIIIVIEALFAIHCLEDKTIKERNNIVYQENIR